MRRTSSSRTDGLVSSSGGEQGFWPSYADMMSAVALILFFLMLIAYIENLITGNNLEDTKKMLDNSRTQLSAMLRNVEEAENELSVVTADLDSTKLTLDAQELEIATQKAAIEAQQSRLDSQTAEIAQQQALIDQQKQYVTAANDELTAMRSQMETIAGLRVSILEQIRDRIAEVMGDASKVSIGDNGNIILSDSVLFDVGSSAIKPQSQPLLNQLIAVFSEFLADNENSRYVESIVISGHTDSTGSAEENRVLATDRANSVLSYLLNNGYGVLAPYSDVFCAAGYGATRPVQTNDTVEGRAANRRIEISMVLKDDTVMDIINDYLKLKIPETE
ncbi:MAG: OmpA family protein [Eubacteriales bacterium]|nr:OmpA family protein [Eubacteriales bacterium]